MSHPFEIRDEVTVDATPAEVWAALTTPAQIDSWFMGHTDVTPGVGGAFRTDTGDFAMAWKVVAWEPGVRLRYEMVGGEEGRSMAIEYTIEGRDGRTAIRFVHSGFLGDDWEGEYNALQEGDPMYLRKLAAYVTHFRGRTAQHSHFVIGPEMRERERAWGLFTSSLGLSATPALGDRASARLEGLPPFAGEVDYLSHDFLGVRTADGLYRFMQDDAFSGVVMVEHHDFSAEPAATTEAWRAWVERTFAPEPAGAA